MSVLANDVPRFPDVSVATAETLICVPGTPNAGMALNAKTNGAERPAKVNTSLTYQSTSAMSLDAPTVAATVDVVFSMTAPLFDAERPRICGGVRSVVVKA